MTTHADPGTLRASDRAGVRAAVPAPHARVAPEVVIRVVGLPSEVLDRLRTPRSAEQVQSLLRSERWIGEEGGALAIALGGAIGRMSTEAAKPAVVGLRRAVHRSRRPARTEWNEHVATAIPQPVAVRVQAWVDALHEWHSRRQRLADTLAAETEALRPVLREVASHPGFRVALAQPSPALHAELVKWLSDPDRAPRRQAQVRLVQFLARAATRTSPFSTYTSLGLASWVPDGPAVRLLSRVTTTSVLEVSDTYGLMSAICSRPHLQPRLPLRTNPSASLQGDELTFVTGPPEAIVTLRAVPAVRRCLQIIDEEEVDSFDRVVERLVALGGGAAAATRFLTGLIESGLVERSMPVADQAADPLGELVTWLAEHDEDDDVIAMVDRVRSSSARPPAVDDADRHGRHLEEVRQAVGTLADRVGLPADRRDGKVVHETTVFTAPAAECALPAWSGIVDDLDTVRHVLGLFDPGLPLRLVLARYHVERFGAGATVPLVLLHRAIHRDFADAEHGGGSAAVRELRAVLTGSWAAPGKELAGLDTPRLRLLGELRERARDATRRPAAPRGVRVPAETVTDLTATWPSWVVPPPSVGYYLQVCDRSASPDVVVNAAHTGWGRGRSRTLHLIGEGAGARPCAVGTVADTTLAAELPATLGLTMNRRLPATALDIDYPSSVSARPVDQRVRAGELEVVHDPATDLLHLVSPRHGSPVTALHLGSTADMFLPPLAGLATQAFGGTWYVHPMAPVLATEADLRVPVGVVARHRITIGRVVLQRARWEAPAGAVPTRRRGEDDGGFLLRLTGWLETHGIPGRFYLRLADADLRSSPGDPVTWQAIAVASSYKPTYVDVSNWWLVQTFERVLRTPSDVVVFEEALPAPGESPTSDAGAGRVTEFLVEVGGRGGTGG